MSRERVFEQFKAGFPRRRFSAGLLVAFIDLLRELEVPGRGLKSFDDLLAVFPREMNLPGGRRANTLVVRRPNGKTLSLRGFYEAAETYYRVEHKRFDYPSAAPHATQAWGDYISWWDALVQLDDSELLALRHQVNDFVLTTLTNQEFDPSSVRVEPPLFRLLLEQFDMAARPGEPTGATFQGIVFGFLRADNPHLQIEIDKVRTGSKRLQRVGDVDGWEGSRLAISAEVKQFDVRVDNIGGFADFANRTGRRGALGLVAALSFGVGAAEGITALGLIPLDRPGMLEIVRLWDPVKQRTAVASFVYYAAHVEKNSSLNGRLQSFLDQAADSWTRRSSEA